MATTPIISFQESGLTLPLSSVDSINLRFSIFNLFTSGSITITDATKAYSNNIKIGDTVYIQLVYDSDRSYIIPLSVLSISRAGSEAIADKLTLSLVSKIYFETQVNTLCHKGNVGTIVRDIAEKFLGDSLSPIENSRMDISNTQDSQRYRYQTGETYPNFIGRIMKYAIIGDEPVYAYFDTKGTFCVKGVSEFKSVEPQMVIAAPSVAIKGVNAGKTMRRMEYYNGVLHMSDSYVSKIESIFCDSLFKSNSDRVTSLESTDISGDQNSARNPSVRKNFPGVVNYYGWHRTPEDTRSIASRNNFESLALNYKFSASFEGWNTRDLSLGTILYLLLPQTPTETNASGSEVNAGEGKYMVTDIVFDYSDSLFTTHATMAQTDC